MLDRARLESASFLEAFFELVHIVVYKCVNKTTVERFGIDESFVCTYS